MFEVSTTSFSHKPEVFSGSSIWLCWSSPVADGQLHNFLELIAVLWLGLKLLVAFKQSSPDMVVQRVDVRRIRRPFIFTNKFTAVGSNPVLSQLCRLPCMQARRPVEIWSQMAKKWQNRSTILNKFRQQGFNVKFSIHFGLVWNEMQSSLPTETDARRNHNVLGELCSLSYQPMFINVGLKAGRGNFEHTLKWTTCQILVFVVTVSVSWQWKLQVAVDYAVQNWKYGIEYSHNFGTN